MYDNEYEWDILLFLRILKYLHTSDAIWSTRSFGITQRWTRKTLT